MSLKKAHLVRTYYCRWAKLFPELSFLIYIITYIISTMNDKDNLQSFILLLVNGLSRFVVSNFQALHDLSHELRIFIVLKCHKGKFNLLCTKCVAVHCACYLSEFNFIFLYFFVSILHIFKSFSNLLNIF